MSASVTVRHAPERHRYEVLVDDEVAGFAVYHRRGGRFILVHTEVDDAHAGQGIGSTLARGALDDIRSTGASVLPLCPFIAEWIDRHPDYADLVDDDAMAQLGLPDRHGG